MSLAIWEKSESELRAVAGFLIANQVRNHIQGMPRHVKKLLVLEELTAFLKIPHGDQIAIDYFERSRKYLTQILAVCQHFSTTLEVNPKVAKAIIGNCSSLLLLRNQNRQDIRTLSGYLPEPIPDVIVDQIVRFPKPADLPQNDRYAGFVYVQLGGDRPQYTVGRNYVSPEVEEITSSSGTDFEAKRRALRLENLNGKNGSQPDERNRLPKLEKKANAKNVNNGN